MGSSTASNSAKKQRWQGAQAQHSFVILPKALTNDLIVVAMARLSKDTFTNLGARPKSNILARDDIAVEKEGLPDVCSCILRLCLGNLDLQTRCLGL